MSEFTLIHPEGKAEVSASLDGGRVHLDPTVVADTLGWQLKEEGLCRGDVCVPVRDQGSLADDRGIDLQGLAEALGLPLALDLDFAVAAVGTPHAQRGAQLDDAEAPDFSLPDATGRIHTLSEHRGKKVLLIAYASW